MTDALIMFIIFAGVFSVPLTAIVSTTWLKAKKLDQEAGGQKLLEKINRLESDKEDLRRRMEILETIVVQGGSEQGRRDGIIGARALDQAEQQQRVVVDDVVNRR
ncbi:MAG: hypothetical protein Q8O67_14440 [Deltaproteobacteria bacterium]|nr:hypothetical protein [Deltaproteobacteria bacterium]